MPDELNSTEFSASGAAPTFLAAGSTAGYDDRQPGAPVRFPVRRPDAAVGDHRLFRLPLPLWFAGRYASRPASPSFLSSHYRPSGSLGNAYRAMALLFAIPTLFYVASHQLLSGYSLAGMSAAIATGYAFLPFVLLAGLSIFPQPV
jgi:hypothetical protein